MSGFLLFTKHDGEAIMVNKDQIIAVYESRTDPDISYINLREINSIQVRAPFWEIYNALLTNALPVVDLQPQDEEA